MKMQIELLHRYISGDANEEEKRAVTEWIQEDEEHLREYMAQRKLYDISIWQTETEEDSLSDNKKLRIRKYLITAMKVAAVVAIVFAGTYFWMSEKQEKESCRLQSIYAPAGQRTELTLSDGSKVWLNARSRLTFPGSFYGNSRKVKLEGEGYFIVAKNKKKPFIVETSRYNIQVVGTEFNVMAYPYDTHWSISLINGHVNILSLDNTQFLKMEPNTTISLVSGHLAQVPIDNTEYFRWREGLICFKDISITKMLEKLKLYYGVNFIIHNRTILSNQYTGKFWIGDGIEHVMKVLQLDNKFTFSKNDDTNTVTIK
jgi:transmembrane sensor